MVDVDVLLPTCDRQESLVMTLSGLASQSHSSMRVIVADQTTVDARDTAVVRALVRILEARGVEVEWHSRPQRLGIAEQRQFLFECARAPYVLYLDDDVFMEPWVLARLVAVIRGQGCGFVGAFPTGLTFREDVRPQQQVVEFWEGPVRPEVVEPESPAWSRAQLHRAANQWHVSRRLAPGEQRLYRVAWIASCILYERAALADIGAFGFWSRLPRYHSGEEVLVQNLILRRRGGCAIMPSGTYHSELPSTVLNKAGAVDGHALALLDEMVARYAPRNCGTLS